MASAIQPDKLGTLLTSLRDQLLAAPEKPGIRDLATKVLRQLDEQRVAWDEDQSNGFFSKYTEIVQRVRELSSAPSAPVEVKNEARSIEWRSGAEWPSLCYFQPHPEFNLLQKLKEMEAKYSEIKALIGAEDFVYDHDWDKSQSLECQWSKQFYNVCRFITKDLPPEGMGFVKALKFVQTFMRGKRISTFRKEQILSLIREIQARLVSGNVPYRNKECFVFNTSKVNKSKDSFKALDAHFKQIKEDKPGDFQLWTSLRAKLWDHKYRPITKGFNPTAEEINLMERHGIGRFPPPPGQIPRLMEKFAEDLCERFKAAEDPFALMSWVHSEYGHIHPYTDANGRGARLLMALIGIQAGISPVILDNDTNYERALTSPNIRDFEVYLRRLHQEQTDTPLCSQFIADVLAGIVKDSV
jgi:hypothetical protein